MAVHMFRVVAENPSGITLAEANQLVDRWLANNTPWTEDPAPHELRLMDGPLTDVPAHFRGDVRFELSDGKASLLDQIETDLSGVVSWYRIAYHRCSHDEKNPQPCSWNDKVEFGTVPSGVPTFEVTND